MKAKDFISGAIKVVLLALINFIAFGGVAPFLVSMKDTVSVVLGGALLLIVVLYDIFVLINIGEKK